MKKLTLLTLIIAIIFLASCTPLGNLYIVSSSTIPLNKTIKTDAPKIKASGNSLESATNKALFNAGIEYNALINVRMKMGFFGRLKITGTPVKITEIK